ncbi:hypothetical protein LTR36_003151 [Oleoguttula mirabilis]|uniref:G-patch domain-containing protein n=1 Tax=Oleoguttula mirabilis TaxID=1507867 RepID=A0AAV9JX15_9PEZI|nr:hypothetical protein LTR36_003151 [Oleoguttula mirabilis]
MAAAEEEEDDYLAMSFDEPGSKQGKETSIQRTARVKREAAERGRVPSKRELADREKTARDLALATQLDASNKGAKMMAKMGFKGGALGKSEDARTQPIEVMLKDDRGGIGMDSEKKRKIREAAAEMDGQQKRRKVGEVEYRERTRNEREERRAEGQMWSAMRTLEGFETGAVASENGDDDAAEKANGERKDDTDKVTNTERKPLHSINILWRPLVKQRLEKERDRRMRYDLDQSLSSRTDYEDPDADQDDKLALGTQIEELDEDDPELEALEAMSFAERLGKIIEELREKYHYCFWCKYRYPDAAMKDCPGVTEDEHG